MKSQPKHSGCKKVAAKNLKKPLKSKGQPIPSAIEGIQIFDNDDQVAKHCSFCKYIILSL